jgi:hypothetical protein
MIPILAGFLSTASPLEQKNIVQTITEKTIYCGSGLAIESASLLARFGWKCFLLTPWASTTGNEYLYLSEILDHAAHYAFHRAIQNSTYSSYQSWYHNQNLLSKIPATSDQEYKLLDFLEKHWLAKASGLFSIWVNWLCPSFGTFVQVHPETTGFYARNPGIKFPEVYKNRVNAWKKTLPHPHDYPLLLTRPCDIRNYLPPSLEILQGEKIQTIIDKLKKFKGRVLVDLTNILLNIEDRQQWLHFWENYRTCFLQACQENQLDPSQFLCIQKVSQEGIGGIRLLPLDPQKAEQDHRFLLEWISAYGVSANRIELDRWPIRSCLQRRDPISSAYLPSKDEFLASLDSCESHWRSSHSPKTLMMNGTLHILKGLFVSVSDDQWNDILLSPTKSALVQISFSKIQDLLNELNQKENELSFFDLSSSLELVHADLCALIEVLSPYTQEDFPKIYQELLHSVPSNLKSLTTCGLHASGMTNLAGIFKAVEMLVGGPSRILYGENAYFENIFAAHQIGTASPIEKAQEQDWQEVDLILAQFNPALKRVNFKVTSYKEENVAEFLHKALRADRKKPLTLAIDCTFDYIDSPQVGKLLREFQEHIENGILNIICYRSGLKFDLFGMDNYCGAPFVMFHNHDTKWSTFSTLSNEPALQADQLSLNWFCLAYKYAASELELYRKQTFENTKALLNAIPSRLFDNDIRYRVIPMDQKANLAFIDLKVFGPCHQLRAAFVIGGLFTVKCMESGHPLFNRSSVGFYHPNITIIFSEECSTIRFTLGLDPSQIAPIARCFAMIDALNGV